MIAATSITATTCRTRAARNGTRPASISSHRPASSSPRVILVVARIDQTARSTAVTVPTRHTVNPPAVSRPTGAPNSVRTAGFAASAAKLPAAAGSDIT
ncbi:hypothetical protein [Actinoplanes solisilvae]|uniref:hypothetical protein n=1 Tax=Actinoplanes solisilvae TaxID=2486853 RepID=UPI000FD7B08C|nr:hypothetical protein [Actinoplanes solisilvae]